MTNSPLNLHTLLLITLLAAGCGGNPMGPFAGGALSAPAAAAPFSDFDQVGRVDTVFIETRPEAPYSVQTWIIALDDKLYVPTSLIMGDSAEERRWVQNIQANPQVRVQIGERVYPMQAERLLDDDRHRAVLEAFQRKYSGELPEIDQHATNAWIFRLLPRLLK